MSTITFNPQEVERELDFLNSCEDQDFSRLTIREDEQGRRLDIYTKGKFSPRGTQRRYEYIAPYLLSLFDTLNEEQMLTHEKLWRRLTIYYNMDGREELIGKIEQIRTYINEQGYLTMQKAFTERIEETNNKMKELEHEVEVLSKDNATLSRKLSRISSMGLSSITPKNLVSREETDEEEPFVLIDDATLSGKIIELPKTFPFTSWESIEGLEMLRNSRGNICILADHLSVEDFGKMLLRIRALEKAIIIDNTTSTASIKS